ncbi:hypothetical protein [Peribacillus loiseleuriae]|uniref:Uncharacterized protein n=1 Tax=Peribacillus loiseleuriae TaxID=1679170 RepID=A0A0K9GSI2_9BACI|nr:hypothetical protein [Peribacillus loiseleuriae]KMY49598.1 hypothetical protein AC625_08625 [Peribacillus loiseleuriae]
MTNQTATIYCPEMGDTKPQAQIEAKFSAIMGKFRISTPLELKGRGIKYHDTYTEHNCNSPKLYGHNIYYVTMAAYKKLEQEYTSAQEVLLD